MDVLSSRILLRPGDLDRSRRFYRDLLGLAIYRQFGPPDDPGLVFFLGQGLLEVSGHAAGPARALGDDLDPGPRRSRRARPAGRLRSPDRAGADSGALGPHRDVDRGPDGIRIILVEVPAGHPLRRDLRPVLPPGRSTGCRIQRGLRKRGSPAPARNAADADIRPKGGDV